MTRVHRLLAAGVAVAALGGLGISAALRGRAAADARPVEPARSLLSGAVTFRLPSSWTVQGWPARRGGEGVALHVPCAPLDGTPHSANVNLLAEPNPDGTGLAEWSARRLAVAAPREIVEERAEGAWRTLVSRGEDRGARYLVVERFGVSARARVHAVAAFPALPEMGEAWFARMAEDVAGFLASLELEGAPPSSVGVTFDLSSARRAAAR